MLVALSLQDRGHEKFNRAGGGVGHLDIRETADEANIHQIFRQFVKRLANGERRWMAYFFPNIACDELVGFVQIRCEIGRETEHLYHLNLSNRSGSADLCLLCLCPT